MAFSEFQIYTQRRAQLCSHINDSRFAMHNLNSTKTRKKKKVFFFYFVRSPLIFPVCLRSSSVNNPYKFSKGLSKKKQKIQTKKKKNVKLLSAPLTLYNQKAFCRHTHFCFVKDANHTLWRVVCDSCVCVLYDIVLYALSYASAVLPSVPCLCIIFFFLFVDEIPGKYWKENENELYTSLSYFFIMELLTNVFSY